VKAPPAPYSALGLVFVYKVSVVSTIRAVAGGYCLGGEGGHEIDVSHDIEVPIFN